MTPEQIVALVGALVQLSPLIPLIIQWANDQVQNNENLTQEEKDAYIARIKVAQASIPEWK
jgi:hypothetical protein